MSSAENDTSEDAWTIGYDLSSGGCVRRDIVCDAVRALAGLRYAGALEVIVVIDGSTDGTATTEAAR